MMDDEENEKVVFGRFGGAPFRECGALYESIWNAIMEYEDRLPAMSVVGVLRLIEHKLLTDVHNGESD